MPITVRIVRIPKGTKSLWLVKDKETGRIYFERKKMSEAIYDVEVEGYVLEVDEEPPSKVPDYVYNQLGSTWDES